MKNIVSRGLMEGKVKKKEMTEEQIDTIVKIIARSTNSPTIEIRASFIDLGFIPIRASLVSTTATDDLHLFV